MCWSVCNRRINTDFPNSSGESNGATASLPSLLHCHTVSRALFRAQNVLRTQSPPDAEGTAGSCSFESIFTHSTRVHSPSHSTTHPSTRSCTQRIRFSIMAGSQQDESMLLDSLTADASTASSAPRTEIAVTAASESSESEERASKRRRFSSDSPAVHVETEEELCMIEPIPIAAAAGLHTSDVSKAAVDQSSIDCDESKQSSETVSGAASLDQVSPDSAASSPSATGSAAAKPASKRRAQACKICHLVLSSSSNLVRHQRSKHKLTTTSSHPQQQQQQQRHSNPAAFIDAQPRRSYLHGAAAASRGAATSPPSPGPQAYRSASKRSSAAMMNASSSPMIPLARSQSLSDAEAEAEEDDWELAQFIAARSAGSDSSAGSSIEDSEERPMSASTSSGDDTKSDDGPPHDAQLSSSTPSSESDSNGGMGMNFPGNPLLYSDEEMQAGCQSFLVWLRYVLCQIHTLLLSLRCIASKLFANSFFCLAFSANLLLRLVNFWSRGVLD